MGDNTPNHGERDDEPRRLGAVVGGSTAVAEEGDIALGVDAGTHGNVLMRANRDVLFEVGRHTDTRGPVDSNQSLSEARATAVADALVALGVTNELVAVGYGESRPIHTNDTTPELQQANRCIKFRVLRARVPSSRSAAQ